MSQHEDGVYYAKGSYDNEVEYHNELICYTNGTDDFINEISRSVQSGNAQTDEVFAEWNQYFIEARESIHNLGAYNGDDTLMNQALQYVDKVEAVKNGLQKFVRDFESGIIEKQKANEAVTPILKDYQQSAAQFQSELTAFLDQYGEEEDDNFSFDYEGMMHVEFDENNPLLQPIHGISLEDYAAAASNIANGVSEEDVAKALGVEKPQWDEANALWINRMQQDEDFTIAGLYGQYFATAHQHPKFANVTSSFETNQENLARVKTDEQYYHELSGAMRAAYEYGIDGAQWLRDKHGLSIGDFQGTAMNWANSPNFPDMISGYQEEMYQKYAKEFAAEQGGNIADDIEF